MNRSAWLALAAIGAAALGGPARADDEWRTVTLDGGVRIDIPAAAAQKAYLPTLAQLAKGKLMAFLVQTASNGELSCGLDRYPYKKGFLGDLGRTDMVERLNTPVREALCGADAPDALIERSQSTTSPQGYAAGLCAAAMTDSSDARTPGHVDSADAIAAPDAFYALTCIVYDKSRSLAADDWKSGMDDYVGHIEGSLRLP